MPSWIGLFGSVRLEVPSCPVAAYVYLSLWLGLLTTVVKFSLEPSFVSYELRNHDFLSCHSKEGAEGTAAAAGACCSCRCNISHLGWLSFRTNELKTCTVLSACPSEGVKQFGNLPAPLTRKARPAATAGSRPDGSVEEQSYDGLADYVYDD